MTRGRNGARGTLACVALIFLSSAPGQAQSPAANPPEGQLAAELRHEGDDFKKDCRDQLSVLSCAADIMTETPVHVAVGSLAPLNGFAFGPALVYHPPPGEHWDIGWDADVIRSLTGSWRAGAYLTIVHTAPAEPDVVPLDTPDAGVTIHTYPVIQAYAQTTSLGRVLFFGLGPDSRQSDAASFGMTETVVGASGAYPVVSSGRWNVSATGRVNGRFVALRGPSGADEPPIASLYSDALAPGLASQPGFLQVGGGARLKPALSNNRILLDYAFDVDTFIAPSDGTQSFHRWTVDLNHEFQISRLVTPGSTSGDAPRGPNECGALEGGRCPAPAANRYGAVDLRFFASRSDAGSSGRVPFYFQPTLGGSDIDASPALSAFTDYRFRGPRALLLQESIEHYVYSIVGVAAMAEQGTVGVTDWATSSFRQSVAAGVTIRAGNLPLARVMWAWGSEGHRFIAMVSPTFIGGASRPSLR